MTTFTRKGFGRIYTDSVEDCAKVRDIIKELDEFEYEYLPNDFVAPFSEYPKLKYTGKFDALDIDFLIATCWKRGIHVFCLDNVGNDYLADITKKEP
jgi:hypothetical protein